MNSSKRVVSSGWDRIVCLDSILMLTTQIKSRPSERIWKWQQSLLGIGLARKDSPTKYSRTLSHLVMVVLLAREEGHVWMRLLAKWHALIHKPSISYSPTMIWSTVTNGMSLASHLAPSTSSSFRYSRKCMDMNQWSQNLVSLSHQRMILAKESLIDRLKSLACPRSLSTSWLVTILVAISRAQTGCKDSILFNRVRIQIRQKSATPSTKNGLPFLSELVYSRKERAQTMHTMWSTI